MRHAVDPIITVPSSTDRRVGPSITARPLLAALKVVARHYERPDSETVLTAGLPLDGDLSLDLLVRAAQRIGIEASCLEERFESLLARGLPLIIFCSDETILTLLEEGDDGLYSALRFPENAQEQLTSGEIAGNYLGFGIAFKPVYAPADIMEQGAYSALIPKEHWFWGTLKRHKVDYLHIVLAAAFINILGVAAPLFIMNVYDRVLPNKAIATLWVLAIGLMLALGFSFLLSFARARLINEVGRRLDMRLASALYEKVLNVDLASRPASTGAFANRVSQYEFIREFFTSNTIALFTDLAFIGIFLVVIWHLAGWIVVFPLLAVIVVVGVGLVLQYLVAKKLRIAQNESAQRQGLLVESVFSLETIKSLRAEGHLLRRWDNFAQASSRTSEQIKGLSSLGVNIAQFVQQLVTVGIIVGGTYSFAEGDLSTGALIATVILSSRALAPLSQTAMTLTRARQALLSVKLLDEIMDMPEDRVSTRGFVNRTIERGRIELRAVRFRYPQTDRFVLNGVSLVIGAGEKVGIVGKIGSGKTTLARLVSGLYYANEGEVLIDGIDIRQYHPYEVRRAVGLVVQEADLFQGSVKENILIGKPDAGDEELIEAAKLAGVDDFVSQHPMGYDMPVGERGSALSGGQRQAIALARVLIDKPTVLMLDEPTSSMDHQSERRFLSQMRDAISPDQTVLVATHRHSLLDLVDRLLVIDQGRIVADGPKNKILTALTSSRTGKSRQ